MTHVHASYGIAVLVAACAACAATDTTVVVDNPITAAQVDDAAPTETPYDESLTYTGKNGEPHNHSDERFRFDVAPFRSDQEKLDAETLYASHAAHLGAHPDAIPSVQTIGTYAKQLDDTIYAGVEHAALVGLAPTIAPKRALLSESLAWLAAHRGQGGSDAAIARIAAALALGGATADAPGDLAGAIAMEKSKFLATPSISKPFGFYTWSAELRGIWQQDRLLQQPLTTAAACSFAQAIAADATRATRYQTLVQLYGRLTNPVRATLVDLLPIASDPSCLQQTGELAFLSTSRSVEVGLYEKLYPNGVPASANLMQDLIDAIRSGGIDLAPKPESGWYQWQEFALETLLVTDKAEERSKIAFMARYKKRLQEAFETMLTQHRETHAKQNDTGEALSAVVEPPTPLFRIEPLATVYVRHARSYVFLEAALDAVEGSDLLDKGTAVDANGVTDETLRTRIRRARDLFYGLYIVSSQDVGMAPKLGAKGDPEASTWTRLASAASTWLESIQRDPIASSDVRVMIPIAAIDDKRARYWAVIGVRTTIAGYSFIRGVDVSPPKPDQQSHVPLPTEQFLEVTSSATPLSREELRAICDQNKTADAIKAAIEAR